MALKQASPTLSEFKQPALLSPIIMINKNKRLEEKEKGLPAVSAPSLFPHAVETLPEPSPSFFFSFLARASLDATLAPTKFTRRDVTGCRAEGAKCD